MQTPPVQMALPVASRDLAEIDAILERAITAGNPLIATEFGNSISKTITMKGIALAKLFWGLRDNWPLFRTAGIEEDFADFVDAHMFVKGKTANRYADMYDAVFVAGHVPTVVREQLKHKSIETLLLMAPAVRDGSLTEDDLADAVVLSHKGVRDRIRERRGGMTNSSTHIYAKLVQRESSAYPMGALVVFGGDGDIEAIGNLNLVPRTESGKKFLERMKNLLGLGDIR
jgi:hypothetical protein